MTDEGDDEFPADRESPVGEPVVRGDREITGQHAEKAVQFDPDEEASLQRAAEIATEFASDTVGTEDNLYMLRGAAACAALVRGERSYKAAAERAGDGVSIDFVRKWARVHDLPRAVRRHVATGEIAPTAAKHIARVGGNARYDLAWAVLDHDLTVREVRSMAGTIADGTPPAEVLAEHDYTPGLCIIQLSMESYRDLRRRATLESSPPDELVEQALEERFEE